MPYDSSKKQLYIDTANNQGITPNEVALCIQDYRVDTNGNVDVGMMCSSPKVSKWAKRKPIRFPKWTGLTDDERKGTVADNNQGIFYGVQFPAAGSAVLDASIATIHDATYDYLQPRGGASEPFRLDDFNGYDHDAEPNPVAFFNKLSDGSLVGYRDDMGGAVGGLQNITVNYSESNTVGINLVEIYASTLGEAFNSEALSKTYPCILISNAAGTLNYFTALEYTDDNGLVGPRPLMKSGVIAQPSRWSVRFTKTLISSESVGDTLRPPFSSDMTGLRASIFLLKSISIAGPLLSGNMTVGVNFGKNWIDVAQGIAASFRAIVVPKDNGVSLSLRTYSLYSYYIASLTQSGAIFSVPLSFYNPQGEATGKSASVTVTITDAARPGVTAKRELTITTPTTFVAMFQMSEMGMVYLPGESKTMVLSVTTEIGGLSHTWTNSITITIQ